MKKFKFIYALIRAPFRLLAIGLAMSTFFIISIPFVLMMDRNPFKIRKIVSKIVQKTCWTINKIFNINITVTGQKHHLTNDENYFIISNHLSYLDVFIFCSVAPASYVTSIEMKNTPILGQASQAAACLFTERRNRNNADGEIKQIIDGLQNKLNVFVFPEATSTNGEQVIMFRKGMFSAPIAAKKEILPLTINYKVLSGSEVSLKNRDDVFWYGDQTFFPHFIKYILEDHVDVEITVHDPVMPEADHCPMELANHCHGIISGHYKDIKA
jgi:lyso-ornithine lipid O-acyltransferase